MICYYIYYFSTFQKQSVQPHTNSVQCIPERLMGKRIHIVLVKDLFAQVRRVLQSFLLGVI